MEGRTPASVSYTHLRDVKVAGNPIRVCEMLATLDGVALAQRVSVDCVKNIQVAKKAIRKGFENQIKKRGYSICLLYTSVDVVDVGVPVLSMHAPFELVSKLDVYMAHQAFHVFFQA